MAERRFALGPQLLNVVEVWHPEVMAIEEPFVPVEAATRGGPKANLRSAIAVGQAQAVALIVAAHYNLPVFHYPPTLVKNVVSGYGQGSKDQVATMVGLLLNLPTIPSQTQRPSFAFASFSWWAFSVFFIVAFSIYLFLVQVETASRCLYREGDAIG
jgi:crossover junction endodeoxyribonuclease RuvC